MLPDNHRSTLFLCDLTILRVSCKWNHTIFGLLWTTYFPEHSVFKVYPHCRIRLTSLPFQGWIIFQCGQTTLRASFLMQVHHRPSPSNFTYIEHLPHSRPHTRCLVGGASRGGFSVSDGEAEACMSEAELFGGNSPSSASFPVFVAQKALRCGLILLSFGKPPFLAFQKYD